MPVTMLLLVLIYTSATLPFPLALCASPLLELILEIQLVSGSGRRMEMRLISCCVVLLILLAYVDARDRTEPALTDGESKISLGRSHDSPCGLCMETSRKAENSLNDPELFDKVGKLSSEVCGILPSEKEETCLMSSDLYVRQTKLFLQELFHEGSLCSSTGLCVDESTKDGLKFADLFQVTVSPRCISCQNAVKEILTRLMQPKMKRRIMETLLNSCEETEKKEEICMRRVRKYAPSILDKVGRMKPEVMCRLMGICDEGEHV